MLATDARELLGMAVHVVLHQQNLRGQVSAWPQLLRLAYKHEQDQRQSKLRGVYLTRDQHLSESRN